ncbi:MmgE/PrpD family protein [Pseudoflavonifractor sp.]|jgi:2-methylcitrate dehydratase PrpD|uniref:MmgE/PrpD family protein n=1 Tax=Pseudoflavonifractor sp. TaxID=1980281 RepID=UPI003D8BB00B
MNNSTALSKFAVDLRYEDIPAEVREMAKKMTIQTIGAALASKNMDFTQSVLAFSKKYGSGDDATRMIDGKKTSLLGAVFTNSIIADNIDWEDCSWTGHPSAGIVPAAFAVSEARGRSGKEMLAAVVAGFEVYQRIAMAIQPPDDFKQNKGWGLTSWQIFASAAPAAKLMNLSYEQYEQALSIAAVLMAMPNSLVHRTMSNVYHYQHGFCAQDGVLSAMLAEHGVDGMTGAFDGPDAFGRHHLITDYKEFWYQEGLGSRWLILETLLKHWPCNMWVQSSLNMMDAFIHQDGVTAENVEEIIVDPPTQMRMTLRPEGYDKIIEAQYSMPFCIAAMLNDPTPGPHWFTTENMHNPKILELAKKVKSGPSPEQDLQESFRRFQRGSFAEKSITIKCTDGRVLTRHMEFPKGHPRNPLSLDEVCQRFLVQTSKTLSREKAEKSLETLMNLENIERVSDISAVLY